MLRWTCGVTKMDGIRNERIRGAMKVGEISKKVQERRLGVVRTCREKVGRMCGERVMRTDCGEGEGKEDRRGDGMDLRRKGLSGGGGGGETHNRGCVEANCQTH